MKRLSKNKEAYVYAALLVLLVLSVALGLLVGAVRITPRELFGVLTGKSTDTTAARILLMVRLPRVLAGIVCGAALAVSGAVIQGVLANGLASPSIIGVNSGAGLAVTLCSALGILGGARVSLFAFLGAFCAVMTVSAGAKRWGASKGTLILMGVALNALLGAVSDAVVTVVPDAGVMSNDFRVGDFSAVTYARLIPAAAAVILAIGVLMTMSNELDVLTLGEDTASSLGMNTRAKRLIFLTLSALLAGAAVSLCGLLSFVGLLVPHAVRRIACSRPKHLIPMSALLGAGFVTLCDTLSRVLFAPYELPVGIIMAFIGAPFFVVILVRKGGADSDRD